MAQVLTVFAKQAWTKGERYWEGAIPLSVEAVRVAVDRSSFVGQEVPDAVKLDAWVSQNGGLSWDYLGGVGISVGVATRGGSPISESGMQRPVPGVGNANRRARVRYSIEDAAVDTKLTVTLLP